MGSQGYNLYTESWLPDFYFCGLPKMSDNSLDSPNSAFIWFFSLENNLI